MSIKTTAPPQTYSRLFRPWDSSDIKPDTDDSNHSFSDAQSCGNSNSSTSTTPIKQSKRAYSLDSTEISARLTVKSAESMARTDLSMAMDAARLASSCVGAFSYPPTLTDPAALSYLGLDPFGIGLMEQEYARVLAEEAAAKQINAKKQRPKKFKCPHCDYAFSNNGQLKGHIRSHLGERPFKCDHDGCGKAFTRNEELTRHKRIHTGLRPFVCPTCNKAFGRRDHLKKHMKTHMVQERYINPALFLPLYPPYLYGY